MFRYNCIKLVMNSIRQKSYGKGFKLEASQSHGANKYEYKFIMWTKIKTYTNLYYVLFQKQISTMYVLSLAFIYLLNEKRLRTNVD